MARRKAHEISLGTYKKNAIKMLRRDFHIRITDADETHMAELENEIQVDNFVKTILNERL